MSIPYYCFIIINF